MPHVNFVVVYRILRGVGDAPGCGGCAGVWGMHHSSKEDSWHVPGTPSGRGAACMAGVVGEPSRGHPPPSRAHGIHVLHYFCPPLYLHNFQMTANTHLTFLILFLNKKKNNL